MAKTPEAKVKDKIKKLLDAHKIYYAMPMGTGYGNSGVPDFLCCWRGKFLAIEAKAGDNVPTALQKAHLERIERCKGDAWVVNELNIHVLEEFLKANNE
jgi:pantoate kinase